jgi:hypothetical protein
MSTNGLIREQQAFARSIAQQRRLSKAEFIKEYISKVDPIVIKIVSAMPESDFYVAPPGVPVSHPVPQTVSAGPVNGAVKGRDGRSAEAHGSKPDIITQSKSDPLGAAQSSDEIVHNVTSAHQVSSAAGSRAPEVKASEKAKFEAVKVKEAAPKTLQKAQAIKVAETAEVKAVTAAPAQATNDDVHKFANDKARTASGLGASIKSPVTVNDGLVKNIATGIRSASASAGGIRSASASAGHMAHKVGAATVHAASVAREAVQGAIPGVIDAKDGLVKNIATGIRSASASAGHMAHKVGDAAVHAASVAREAVKGSIPSVIDAKHGLVKDIATGIRSASASAGHMAHQVGAATVHAASVAREAVQGAMPGVIDAKDDLVKNIATSIRSASASAGHMAHKVGAATVHAASVVGEKAQDTFSAAKDVLSPIGSEIAAVARSAAESVAVVTKDVVSPAPLSTQEPSSYAKHTTENIPAKLVSVLWEGLASFKQYWPSWPTSKATAIEVDNFQSETAHPSAERVDKCSKNLFSDSCNSAKCLTADECKQLGGQVEGEDCIYKCLS